MVIMNFGTFTTAIQRCALGGRAWLRKGLRSFVVLVAILAISGCAVNRQSATLTPGTSVATLKSFYVGKHPGDDHDVAGLIAADLTSRGFTVTTGPEGANPDNVDAVVTYQDKWFWDITLYLLELTITVRNPASNFPMAVGNSFHTSLTRETAETMVKEVTTNIFKQQ